MSVKAVKWALALDLKEPGAPIKSRVHIPRKLVAVVIAEHADDLGDSFPGQQLIAKEAGVNVSTVKEHAKWLDQQGYLTRERRHRPNGSHTSDGYHLHLGRCHRPSPWVDLGRCQTPPGSASAIPRVGVTAPHNHQLTTTEPPEWTRADLTDDRHPLPSHQVSQEKSNGKDQPPPPLAELEASGLEREAEPNGCNQEVDPDLVAACVIAKRFVVDVRQVQALEWKRGVAVAALDAAYVHTGGEEGLQRLVLYDRHRAAGRNLLSARAQANAASATLLPLPAIEVSV